MRRCKDGQKGSTLVMALVVFLVFMVLATTILNLTFGRTYTLTGNIAQTRARYAAQSGVAAGLAALKKDKDKVGNQVEVTVDNETIVANIIKPGSNDVAYEISSTATGREGSREFQATATARVKLGFDWLNWPYALVVGGDFTGGNDTGTELAKIKVHKGKVQVNGNWKFDGESRFEESPTVAGEITENFTSHWKNRGPKKGTPIYLPEIIVEDLDKYLQRPEIREINLTNWNPESGNPIAYFKNADTQPLIIYNGNPKSPCIIVADKDIEIYAPAKKGNDKRKKEDTNPVVIISLSGSVTIKEAVNFDGFIYAARDINIEAVKNDGKHDNDKKWGKVNINGGIMARGNFNLNKGDVKIRLWEKGHNKWWKDEEDDNEEEDDDRFKSILNKINSSLRQYMSSFQIVDWQESYR
ncbi:MAG: hypothetical protein ACOY3H_00515 [Bacillota bacterium]